MSLRHRLLSFLRARLADDPPSLRLRFWDGEAFDFTPSPSVTLSFRSPQVLRSLLKGDFAKLGDAYVAGDLVVEGAIDDTLRIGIDLAERLGKSPMMSRLARLAARVPRRHSRRQDAADISYHYDVSNAFYRLWLDENMVYSCAYFRNGTEDIHQAQRQKLDHICRKLLLRRDERLLDIGCGWGGLVHWAAKNYGVKAVGITLSEQQYGYAREWIAASGLADRVEIRLQHYRDLAEDAGFDKIISVGMYEHVGLADLPHYFETVARLLRPGGAFLNHGIVATDPQGRPRGPAGGEFIDRYVFPGGAVPHVSRGVIEIAKAGLELVDIEDLRPHYARTLLCWVHRLEACREEALAAAGPERLRIWRVYLAGMAHAFDRGWLSVAQLLAYKPTTDGVVLRPWTRDYQYTRDNDAPRAGRLDWTMS